LRGSDLLLAMSARLRESRQELNADTEAELILQRFAAWQGYQEVLYERVRRLQGAEDEARLAGGEALRDCMTALISDLLCSERLHTAKGHHELARRAGPPSW